MPDIREPVFAYPKSAVMFPCHAKVIVGNPLSNVHTIALDFALRWYQNPPANGDTLQYNFYLAGGSYTLKVHGETESVCGRIDWYIDNVKVVSLQDWYSAGAVSNVIQTADVTVLGNGKHTLRSVINGKNPASTGFYIQLASIALA